MAKYSLSADLKYALFAYDVKQVSFKRKIILIQAQKDHRKKKSAHGGCVFLICILLTTAQAVIAVAGSPSTLQPFVYFLAGCHLHCGPVQHLRVLSHLHAQTHPHCSALTQASARQLQVFDAFFCFSALLFSKSSSALLFFFKAIKLEFI